LSNLKLIKQIQKMIRSSGFFYSQNINHQIKIYSNSYLYLSLFYTILVALSAYAQIREIYVTKTEIPPNIDDNLNDAIWQTVSVQSILFVSNLKICIPIFLIFKKNLLYYI